MTAHRKRLFRLAEAAVRAGLARTTTYDTAVRMRDKFVAGFAGASETRINRQETRRAEKSVSGSYIHPDKG